MSQTRSEKAAVAASATMGAGAVAAALFCSMLWGINSAAVRIAGEAVPPWTMAAIRFLLGCLATGAFARQARVRLHLDRWQWTVVLINGLMLYAQIGLFTVGTVQSTSVHSVILINVYPFFTAVFSHFWLLDYPLTARKVAGLVLAFVGMVTLFGDQLAMPDLRQLEGDLFVLISAAILGLKVTYVKSLLGRIAVLPLVFWEAVTAVPLFLVTGWYFETLALGDLDAVTVGSLFYQGWAVSCVGFLVWTRLLARHSPNDLAAYSFTTPVFGAVFGWLVLGEPLTGYLAAGGLLAALGIYLVNARY